MAEESIDLGIQIKTTSVQFRLCPELWNKCDLRDLIELKEEDFIETKFLNEDGTDLDSGMNNLPRDKGGIYLIYAKSMIIPFNANLMYIGRAKITNHQNLKKRVREYYNPKDRPKIKILIKLWGTYLYVRYLPLEDNLIIEELEKRLINSILPPFNNEIPDKIVRDAVSAFNF